MKMESTMEQTVNVKFCVKLQKSPSEMLEMLKTIYNESTWACVMFLSGINVSEKAEKMWTTMKDKMLP